MRTLLPITITLAVAAQYLLFVTALVQSPVVLVRRPIALAAAKNQHSKPQDTEFPDTDLVVRYRNRSRLLESTLRHKVQALQLSDQKLHVLEDAIQRLMRRTKREEREPETSSKDRAAQPDLQAELAHTQLQLQEQKNYWTEKQTTWIQREKSLVEDIATTREHLQKNSHEERATSLAMVTALRKKLDDFHTQARKRELKLQEKHATERAEWQATVRTEVDEAQDQATTAENQLREQHKRDREDWKYLEMTMRTDSKDLRAQMEKEQRLVQEQQKVERALLQSKMTELRRELQQSKAERDHLRDVLKEKQGDWSATESILRQELTETKAQLRRAHQEVVASPPSHEIRSSRLDNDEMYWRAQDERDSIMVDERANHWEQIDKTIGEAWRKHNESSNEDKVRVMLEDGEERTKGFQNNLDSPERKRRRERFIAGAIEQDRMNYNDPLPRGRGRMRRLASRLFQRPRSLVGKVIRRSQSPHRLDEEDEDGL